MIKKFTFAFLGLVVLLSLYLISSSFSSKQYPEVKSSFVFSRLTDEDFDSVGSIEKTTKEDFSKVYISFSFINSKNLSDRKIIIPDFKNLMNSYDIERYWYGQSSVWDSPASDAEYSYDIMFLSKNLTEEQIKFILKDAQVIITWKNKDDKEESIKINVVDMIDFK